MAPSRRKDEEMRKKQAAGGQFHPPIGSTIQSATLAPAAGTRRGRAEERQSPGAEAGVTHEQWENWGERPGASRRTR